MMQVSLPSEYRRRSLALGLKPVLADTLRVKKAGCFGTSFSISGTINLSPFWNRTTFQMCRQSSMRAFNRGLGVPAGFYHFAFEAGSPAALADKRDELRAKGVEVTDIVDHGWSRSIYFKDPNGLSLEYCCTVRNLTEDDAIMQERYTIPRAALDPGNATSAKVS
jgi:catechol 2,3-dioxygenase-like lactoylglutathione lyase family enzyme